MKRIILSGTVVLLTAAMIALSSLSGNAQEGYSGQYATDGQYASDAQYASAAGPQEGCGWYWDYTFNKNGGWEWWCWDPDLGGWWRGESEDGKKKIFAPKVTSGQAIQFIAA